MIVQPVVEPMEHYTALVTTENIQNPGRHQAPGSGGKLSGVYLHHDLPIYWLLGAVWAEVEPGQGDMCGLR